MKRVCVVTGSRADYGLLRWVIEGLAAAPDLQLQLIATGMHLSPEFGLTVREIEADGFHIDRTVESLLSSTTANGVTKSIGVGVIGFSDAFAELSPDLVVVLGDRYEIFAAAISAMVARIPIAHLHGGEVTEGAIDEAIRHSITKMSHLHFVATEVYRRRVIQLGEQPDRVFCVGAPGLDSVEKLELLSRAELEADLDFALGDRNLLVTFHPPTLSSSGAVAEMGELLAALDALADTHLIFTMPNADPQGGALMTMVDEFVAQHPLARSFTSLGQLRYLSCMRYVDGVVGNSSSGLIEAPFFKVGTVNIGDRQKGRVRATSVIDCPPDRMAIGAAIERLYSPTFRRELAEVTNPYGTAGASARIVEVIQTVDLSQLFLKSFRDDAATGAVEGVAHLTPEQATSATRSTGR